MIYPIRKIGDPVLRAKAKEVTKIDDTIRELVKDMYETMYDAPGVGLAAPQIGVSARIVVIDVDDKPITLINPVIIAKRGSQIGEEGCLSVPNEHHDVERYNYVKVRALNEKGRQYEIEGEELLARAFQHEIDHLDGILFIDKAVKHHAKGTQEA
jgi:peptide deformylase